MRAGLLLADDFGETGELLAEALVVAAVHAFFHVGESNIIIIYFIDDLDTMPCRLTKDAIRGHQLVLAHTQRLLFLNFEAA